MPGFVDTVEQALLNHFIGKSTYTPPATWYLALSSTTPTDAGGNFTEATGSGYARAATTAADWNVASGTAPASIVNATTISFPTAGGDWSSQAVFSYVGMFTSSSGGTVQCYGAVGTGYPVYNGDTPQFAPGALVVELGDPTDTY